MTSLIWMLENDLCRCCHSKGDFMDLAEPCKYFGGHPKYADMLRDCLDVYVSPVPGDLCTVTYKICEECASQLLAAATFKKQVKIAEDRFKDMYSRNLIKVPDSIIQEEVKVELMNDSDNDYKDDFMQMEFNSDEDPIYDVKIEFKKEEPKPKVKKPPKPKSKAKKTAKKPSRPKKDKDKPNAESNAENDAKAEGDAEADGDAETGDAEADVKNEEAEKKGGRVAEHNNKKRAPHYTIVEDRDGKIHACVFCSGRYKTREAATNHYSKQHAECNHCFARFTRIRLALHKEKEHGIPAPTCGVCGKKFRLNSEILQHQKIYHMGEKFTCDICNMQFFSNHRTRHMVKHSSVRAFICEYCKKSFKWKGNLITHIMIHLNDKKKMCPVCGEKFVQRASLTYHLSKKHPEYREAS